MSSSNTTMKNGRVRKCLPNNISPLHYDIFLNHKDDHFNGIVIIKISVKQETNIIRLNSKGLEIIRCEVDGTECSFSEEECEEFEINAVKKILDTSLLRIEFKGLISNNMKGFYVSRYSVNGHDKKLYSTKFEPTHARMLIPCFDQPDMKATFKLKLETDNVDVISNTDGKIQLLENGRKITSFEQTPKMSTYLLAFVIGELEYLEKEIPGIVIRTYTIKGEKGKGRYALDVAAQCLDFFQKHFSFPYPLKKLDLVGIPEFASGAMENWGLITFRETTLLYDPHNSNIHQKKRIAEVVCHEIAHQWFGNLVTMKWWDELWLNEGFATYAASLAMENIPIVNWDVWTDFIAIETERGLEEDALNSSHPIKVEVMDPNDIGQIFDGISYSKSASLIRMIENFIGREKFRSGLSRYINEFQYSNATTADLWEMLSDEKHDVANIMNCWVNRKGFPLVRVDEMNGQVVLTQEKFKPKLPDESAKDKSDDDLWMIPMTIISGKTKTKILMKQKTEKIHINGNFKVNHDGAAFIRVLYNSSKYILGNDFDVRDRLTFVNDIISLTLSSYIPIKIFLNMLNYFVYERNYEILKAVIRGIAALRNIFPEKKEFLNKKIINLLDKQRVHDYSPKSVELSKDEVNQSSLNSLIVSALVEGEDRKTLCELNLIFIKGEEIHPIYRSAMFRAVVILEDSYEKILDIYKTGNISFRVSALMSLGMTKNHIKRHLNQLLGDEVKLQDKIYIVFGLMSRIESRKDVVDFFILNFDQIRIAFRENGNLLSYCIEETFSYALTYDDIERFKVFFANINQRGIERSIKKAIEKSYMKISIRGRNKEFID